MRIVEYIYPSKSRFIRTIILSIWLFFGIIHGQTVMQPNGTSSGTLSQSSPEAVFSITTTVDGALWVTIISNSAAIEIDVTFLDTDDTTIIASDARYGDTSLVGASNLLPGTYFVHPRRYSGEGAFTITSTFVAQDEVNDAEVNDSVKVPLTMALNTSATGHLGYYGSNYLDKHDWYSFTVPADGSLMIDIVTDSTLEADVVFFDTDGVTNISADSRYGLESIVGLPNLAPGIYLMDLIQYSGYGGYAITATYVQNQVQIDEEPNDTVATADTLSLVLEQTGHLGYYASGVTDKHDWYHFTVPANGETYVNIVTDSTLEADVNLYDTDAATNLQGDQRYGTESQVGRPNLAPGTYYIDLYHFSGYGSYSISVEHIEQATPIDTEPNDSTATALSLILDSAKTGHLGYYSAGITDRYDWYKVTTTAAGPLWFHVITDSTLEADIVVYQADGVTSVASDVDYGTASVAGGSALAAGTYYLRVFEHSGQGGYTVVVSGSETEISKVIQPKTAVDRFSFVNNQAILSVSKPEHVTLALFNPQGKLCMKLFDNTAVPGVVYTLPVKSGSTGIYYLICQKGKKRSVKKINLLK